MSFLHRNHKQLEDAFRAAYQDKEHAEGELSSRWQMDVMRDIRRLGPLNGGANPLQIFNQFAWRFATVACMIALILSVYVGVTGFNPTDAIADMFLDAPIEFTLTQVYGE